MKKIFYATVLAIIAIAPSCRKVKEIADVSFSSEYNQDATVPEVPGHAYGEQLPASGVDVVFSDYVMQTNAQQFFDDNHISSKNIKTANFQYGTFTLMAGSNNLDFMDKIEIYASAEGLPEVLVAYQYSVPKGQKVLTLIPVDVNMREYLKRPVVIGRVHAHFNTIPVPGTLLNISSNFNVVANALVNYD